MNTVMGSSLLSRELYAKNVSVFSAPVMKMLNKTNWVIGN